MDRSTVRSSTPQVRMTAANDFWGIYKEDNSPHFYASDRNGGLDIFQLKGSGSDD